MQTLSNAVLLAYQPAERRQHNGLDQEPGEDVPFEGANLNGRAPADAPLVGGIGIMNIMLVSVTERRAR